MLRLLDIAEVKRATEAHVASCEAKAGIFDELLAVLKARQGKQIDKRIVTELQKRLGPQWVVYWRTEYSWKSVCVWNNSTVPHDNRFDCMIAYDSDAGPAGDGSFDFDHWRERYAKGHGNDRFREFADCSTDALKFLAKRVKVYNTALASLEAAQEQLTGLITS